jgi:hypothetical protein
LLDLSKYAVQDKIEQINPSNNYNESVGNIIPYGFNGVFTHKNNGSAILNGGISLYSPSGIYPGNDALDSNVVKNVLSQSANLEVANIITGLINTPKGKEIDGLFHD